MAVVEPTAVQTARVAFSNADRDLVGAIAEVATKTMELALARRGGNAGAISAAQAALTQANNDLASTRTAITTTRQGLNNAISTWLSGTTPQTDIGRLDATDPIVFLPVRVETRFDRTTSPGNLLVRIYPDDVFVDVHEDELTQKEIDAGEAFYTELTRLPITNPPVTLPANFKDAPIDLTVPIWKKLTDIMSPERAAYVVRKMFPQNYPQSPPSFDAEITVASSTWNRPGRAVLPDRWVVIVYRAGAPTRTFTTTTPVREPLIATMDPNATVDASTAFVVPGSNGLYKIDPELAWTVDFQSALDAGMAIKIPLASTAEATDGTGGYDRIVVFGVKTSMPPENVPAHLQELLDGHHYTRGLGLVRQGSPTNNTDEKPTPVPRGDGGSRNVFIEELGIVSFWQPRGPDLDTGRGGDVGFLANYLGVRDGVFPNVVTGSEPQGSHPTDVAGHEGDRAVAMSRATWPVLFGYALENLFTTSGIPHDAARDYFSDWVFARGPLPAFRIGQVPYGVLPVLSLNRWVSRAGSQDAVQNTTMIDVLKRMRGIWLNASAGVDRVKGSSTDPFGDLLKVLALYPSAREVRLRTMLGPALQYNLSLFAGIDFQIVVNAVAAKVAPVLASIGKSAWGTSLVSQLLGHPLASQIVFDLVAPPSMISEDSPLPDAQNYIKQLALGQDPTKPPLSIATLLADTFVFGNLEKTLLYKVLRHAVLRETARLGAVAVGQALAPRLLDFELDFIKGTATTAAVQANYGQLLTHTDFTVTPPKPPTQALGDYIRQQFGFSALANALTTLAAASTAELDRLFSETLDLSSHRLDAWITALATTRLDDMRAAQVPGESTPAVFKTHFGGYALLENVRPSSTAVPSAGFIQSPSNTHAAAAAILRNGHLAYRAEDPQKYAFDLSSARVRQARDTLDAVRSGQPLGAVLGQRFEAALAAHAPTLNRYRYALRRYFPQVADKATAIAAGESADVVAARNVVDGLRLWMAFTAVPNQLPFGHVADLPNPNIPAQVADYNAVINEIKALADPLDAVADLVIAESVYQLTRGNVGNAAGNLDALSRGTAPPDPEIARSARGGTGVTERVAFVFPVGGAVDQPSWPAATWTAPLSPRATIEPLLDKWAGGLLGDPTKTSCAVTLSGTPTPKKVTLADLTFDSASTVKLRPLDVLALARAQTGANQGSVLDRYIAAAALKGVTGQTVTQIDYTRQGQDRTFPETMSVALAIAELCASARALAPADLAVPAETDARKEDVEASALPSAQSLANAASSTLATLDALKVGLAIATASNVRFVLEGVAPYLPFARPAVDATDVDLLAAAKATALELDARLGTAAQVPSPGADAASIAAAATEILRALLGSELLPLPSFEPPAAGELLQSLNGQTTLLGSDGTAIRKFLQRASQVQAGLGRWRTLSLYLGALGGPRPRLDAAQLPFAAGERWAALPFTGATQPRGRTAFTLLSHETAVPAPSDTTVWRGIVIDDWVEIVPDASEQTALAFHHDHPLAEAGQAILIAVPSSVGTTWVYDDIVATLNETLDLAKIRAVDAQRVDLGQLLPTAYMAETLKGATVTTSWLGALRVAITGVAS